MYESWSTGLGLGALTIIFIIVSLLQTGLRSLSKVVLRRLADEAAPPARGMLDRYLKGPMEFMINLQLVLLTSLVGIALLVHRAVDHPGSQGTMLSTFLILLGGLLLVQQMCPRIVLNVDAERLVSRLLPAYRLLEWPTRPVTRIYRTLFRQRQTPQGEVSEEEIRAFLDEGEEAGIIRDEGEILESIFEFSETVVREVMRPRIDMVCIEADSNLARLRDVIIESKHSRIPVFRDRVDNIVGVAFLKDLPEAWRAGEDTKSVVSLMRRAHFVPETMRVATLLREFQRERIQIAIVVDEYGGTSGLVTVEDLLEEIVGELTDEHEKPLLLVAKQDDGSYLVSGKAEIDTVEELFNTELEGEDFDTVAGLVVATLGRVPSVGERFTVNGLEVEVVDADHRRVNQVRLRHGASSTPPRAEAAGKDAIGSGEDRG